MRNNSFRTRFAPSPTGPLHLGHAFSALTGARLAQQHGGTFLLRIEDIDQSRARPAWEAAIFEDLAWLGLSWPTPVLRQSTRLGAYRTALARLWDQGLLYPCICRRRDIEEALSAPQGVAPTLGPDGLVYPGTCRGAPRTGPLPEDAVLRLDMAAALRHAGSPEFTDNMNIARHSHDLMISSIGDVVLARRDMGTSYHLSVVVDDAWQGITDVVRGMDLQAATPIHALLQDLLGLPHPRYHHHRLITDRTGRRLAKRDDARAIARYREEGCTPRDILRMIDL